MSQAEIYRKENAEEDAGLTSGAPNKEKGTKMNSERGNERTPA